MKIEIKNRWTDEIILCGEYESIKDCLEKNRDANLRGANLGGANLWDANLRDAYLEGAKNYFNSHDFFAEIVRQQSIKTFSDKEWSMIGQVWIHRLCWDSIKKRFGKKFMPIFKKLSKEGFKEFEEKYQKVLC